MVWNWQLPDWPDFTYNLSSLFSLEKKFLQEAGGTFAILKHLDDNKKKQFVVEILSLEGIKSAEIEGEILQRESLQSSIQRHFGLKADDKKILPKEKGMADLLYQIYATYDQPLNHKMLFEQARSRSLVPLGAS